MSSTHSPPDFETTDFKKNGRIVRPPGSFMIFISRFRACNKFPGGGQELTRAASVAWWSLTEEERQQYEVLAAKAAWRHKCMYPDFNHVNAKKEAAKKAKAAKEEKRRKRNNSTPRKPRSRKTKARSNAYDAQPEVSSPIGVQTGFDNPNMHFNRQAPSPENNAPQSIINPESYHEHYTPVQRNPQAGNWDNFGTQGTSYSHGMMFNPTLNGFALSTDASDAFTANQQQIVNHEMNLEQQQMPVTRTFQSPVSSALEGYYPRYFQAYTVPRGLPITSSHGLHDTPPPSAPLAAPLLQSPLPDASWPGFIPSNQVNAYGFGYTHESSPFAAPYPTPPSDSDMFVGLSPQPGSASLMVDPGSFDDSWLDFDYEQMATSAYPSPSDSQAGPSSFTGNDLFDLSLTNFLRPK